MVGGIMPSQNSWMEKIPDIYNGKILVPYSPEAALSGVGE